MHMRKPVGKGLSLKWGLLAIMALCWIVPIAVILLYSSYTISTNVQGRIRDTISNSVSNAFQQTEDNLSRAMDKSRASSYDDTIRDAYERYLLDGDGVTLNDTVTAYLTQQYGYDSSIKAAFLFFTSSPGTICRVINSTYAGQAYSYQDYRDTFHQRVLDMYPELSTSIGFLQGDTDLYLVRNIVDRSFAPYAVIVLKCSENELFQSIRSIVWLKQASLSIDGLPFAVVIPVEGVAMSRASETMNIDGTIHLSAAVLPGNATYPDITWTSSDTKVATVDQTGKVTAVGLGQTAITAAAEGVSDTCTVSVVDGPVQNTALNRDADDAPLPSDDTGGAVPLQAAGEDGAWYDEARGEYTIQLSGKLSGHTLSLRTVSDSAALVDEFPNVRTTLPLMALAAIPILLFVIWAYYHYISQPMAELTHAAARMEAGERGYLVEHIPGSREFGYLTERFNSMSTQLKYQFERSYQEQLALQDARVMALRSQINPHFLNNTLEVIGWEARMAKDEKVCRMIEALSMMLTAAVARGGSARGNMRQELNYTDAYLYILSVRLRERLSIRREIEPGVMNALVPCLILQPIVENAIEHGIGRREKGELVLRAKLRDAALILEVENDGHMTEKDKRAVARLLNWDGESDSTEGEGRESIGIRNVNRRLKILYGEEGGLTIEEITQGRVLARIVIPRVEFDKE